MPSRRSRSRSPERRAALDALNSIVARMDTPVLIAWLPLLTEAASTSAPASARMVTRFTEKLDYLWQWAALREAKPDTDDHTLFRRTAEFIQAADPTARVSARSLRKWRDDYNRIGPDGLAAGPAALLDRYTNVPQGRPPLPKRM